MPYTGQLGKNLSLGGNIVLGFLAAAFVPPSDALTFNIQFAFGVSPMTIPSVWTDVTDHTRGFSIQRGRTHELSRTQAGELQLRLSNQDRRFDPSNTSSPYFPNVTPMTQVAVLASYAGVVYPIFWGFVEDWGQQWNPRPLNATGDAECVVKVVDGFKVLGLATLTPYSELVLSDEPVSYCRLSDVPNPTAIDEGSSAATLVSVGGSIGFQQGPAPLIGGAPSAYFAPAPAGGGRFEDAAAPPELTITGDVSVECWLLMETGGGPPTVPQSIIRSGSPTVTAWRLTYEASGSAPPTRLAFKADTNSSFPNDHVLGWNFTPDGTWLHVVCVRSGRDLFMYVNGALVAQGRFQGSVKIPTNPRYQIGDDSTTPTSHMSGSLAQVAVYNHALSAERVAAHYAATFDAFIPQLSGQHITSILDIVGWPVAAREIDAGSSMIGEVTPSGSALDWLLRIAEDSERGLLGFDNGGVLRFHDRHSLLLDHLTSEDTFGDSSAEMSYADLSIRNDDGDLWTSVQVSQDEGATALVTDAAAEALYGPRTLDISGSLVADAAEVQNQAEYLLAKYKAPASRLESVTLIPANNAAQIVAALSLDCHHDRITVKRRPPGGGPVINVDVHIEGLRESLDAPRDFVLAYDTVPADAAGVPWILEDAVNGVLDTTTDLGY